MENNLDSAVYILRVGHGPDNSFISCTNLKRAALTHKVQIEAKRQRKELGINKPEYPFDPVRAAKRTGKSIIKTLHDVERWDNFLTMYLPVPTKGEIYSGMTLADRDYQIGKRLIELKNCFSRFATQFKKSLPQGWMFYWFEVNKYGQVHVHACVKCGLLVAWFQTWAKKAWSVVCRGKVSVRITGRSSKVPVKCTPYNQCQTGYACRNRKKRCRVELASIAHERKIKTMGFVGKDNCQFITAERFNMTQDELLKLQKIIITNMVWKALLTGYGLNLIQISRIQGGDFYHGFIDTEEVEAVLAYLRNRHRRKYSNHTVPISVGQYLHRAA